MCSKPRVSSYNQTSPNKKKSANLKKKHGSSQHTKCFQITRSTLGNNVMLVQIPVLLEFTNDLNSSAVTDCIVTCHPGINLVKCV